MWYSQEPNNPFASASTRLMMIMHCNSVTNWWTFVWMLNFHWKSVLKKSSGLFAFSTYLLITWCGLIDLKDSRWFSSHFLFWWWIIIHFKKNHFKRPFASFSKVRNGILLPKLVWPTVRKKLVKWLRKTFEVWTWKMRIWFFFDITRTIYSNSGMSEQFFITAFLTCMRFLISNKPGQLKFNLKKVIAI